MPGKQKKAAKPKKDDKAKPAKVKAAKGNAAAVKELQKAAGHQLAAANALKKGI